MLVAAVIMSHPLQHIILKFVFDGIGTYREGWGVNITFELRITKNLYNNLYSEPFENRFMGSFGIGSHSGRIPLLVR